MRLPWHAEIIEDLSEYLSKIKALIEVALNSSLDSVSPEAMYNYLWELDSLVLALGTVLEDLK